MKSIFLSVLFLLITACSHFFANDSKPARKKTELATTTPFELADNRIFINVFINHDGPFKFLFDTGSTNVMTPEVAKKLKLPLKKDPTDAKGAGEKSVQAYQTKVDQIQLGQIVFLHQDFHVIDLSEIKKALKLPALDGAFGYEVLEEYIVSVQFQDQMLTLDKSFKENMRNGYQSLPFQLIAKSPVINAKINNQSVQILLDTGDRSALTILKNFRGKKEIADIFKNSKEQVTDYGVGGPIPALLGRANILELTPSIKLRNVMARAPTTAKGFNALQNIDASIGNEILKQFDVIFDYRGKNIYLKKNDRFGQPTQFNPVN